MYKFSVWNKKKFASYHQNLWIFINFSFPTVPVYKK